MKTNYERIKNMNLEEMANWTTNIILNEIAINSNRQKLKVTCDVINTYNEILRFLQSESEEQ